MEFDANRREKLIAIVLARSRGAARCALRAARREMKRVARISRRGRNFRQVGLKVIPLRCTFDRGGVSLETEKGKSGTTSKLLITRAQLNDSGNYTCASSKVTPASVMVHVLNGEQNTAV